MDLIRQTVESFSCSRSDPVPPTADQETKGNVVKYYSQHRHCRFNYHNLNVAMVMTPLTFMRPLWIRLSMVVRPSPFSREHDHGYILKP